MVKVIVFDLGKVLVDFDYSIAVRRIASRGRKVIEEIGEFLLHTPLLLQYESGRVTTQRFFEEICAATGFCGDQSEFARSFGDIFTPIEPMIEMKRELRRRGYPAYVFSNTNELAVQHLRDTFPFFKEFDGYILSYEHGVMKPDAKLYEVVERETGSRGAEIVYLDDRAENVAAGAERGWHAVLHQTPGKSRRVLEALSVLGNGTNPRTAS
jgi:HAD superfamily hydrolase (TIGR01509 family)